MGLLTPCRSSGEGKKKKRQLISSTVFIAQRLLAGLMVWTNARLPLIGLFLLPEWFSGGSLMYVDMTFISLELMVISQTDLCCYWWAWASEAEQLWTAFRLAGYPVQASAAGRRNTLMVFLVECTAMWSYFSFLFLFEDFRLFECVTCIALEWEDVSMWTFLP